MKGFHRKDAKALRFCHPRRETAGAKLRKNKFPYNPPRSTRAGPAKSRGGGAVNDNQLSGSCKTACLFLVLIEPLSGLAERAAFFLP